MKDGKKIISFSLWGDEDKYCIGAIRNAQLQQLIYSDWICRFYIEARTVPHMIVNKLCEMGCEVEFRKNEYYGEYASGKFWRHSIMSDSEVERFIVRDTDSRLSGREKRCVDEWIESGKTIHIIRDHPHHGHRMMGGMWGGVNTSELNYEQLLAQFLKSNDYHWKKKRQMDQQFLSQMIYPKFRNDMFIHDNYQFFTDEQVHKISGKGSYIGEIVDV